MMLETYKPVTHTAEDNAHLMSNPKIRIVYDAPADKYAALNTLLKARGCKLVLMRMLHTHTHQAFSEGANLVIARSMPPPHITH